AGRYRAIPWKSIAAIAGALLYVLNPIDLIPDIIFGIGFLDDAGIVALCLKLVESDLHRYAAWKAQQDDNNVSTMTID
ncbi:YkvA family protein, partial [Marinobacter nauticus]|uniref:YkvA family protein n=1 Tax=Marinobacter nauticus TaxID=2743 RepID=UPI0011602846